MHGPKKMKRGNRPYDCQQCDKVPQETREQLTPLGIKFGPERATNIKPAMDFLVRYYEVQAGAPYPDCSFTSRLYGIITYMLAMDAQHAQRQALRVPGMLRTLLEHG